MNRQLALRSHEYGGVLITGLLTLILLTAIGLAATTSSITENEIAINERNLKEAFYASELAMQAAEDHIYQLQARDEYDTDAAGLYARDQMPAWNAMYWNSSTTHELPALPAGSQQFAEPPRYTVGARGFAGRDFDADSWGIGIKPIEGRDEFIVVGQGTGAKQDAKAFVTSIFGKRFAAN